MKKYSCIVADPPWKFGDTLDRKMKCKTKRSAVSQYKVMSVNDIMNIDVPSITDPSGCLLVMWVPSSLLLDGLAVMAHWGFKFKGTYIWVKLKKDHATEKEVNKITRVGMGHMFRQSHEIALIGTKGSPGKKLKNRSQRSVSLALNIGHSIKPGNLQDSIDEMFPGCEKVELFARRSRAGWDVIGDAVTGVDINDSIQTLNSQEDKHEEVQI
jgi:N6-adenosine-specific RNA methylase IME4